MVSFVLPIFQSLLFATIVIGSIFAVHQEMNSQKLLEQSKNDLNHVDLYYSAKKIDITGKRKSCQGY